MERLKIEGNDTVALKWLCRSMAEVSNRAKTTPRGIPPPVAGETPQ